MKICAGNIFHSVAELMFFSIFFVWLHLLQEFKRETRFTSKCPANEIISKIEQAAKPLGFDVRKKNYKVMVTFKTKIDSHF